MEGLLFVGVIIVVGVVFYFNYIRAKKRREGMQALASELGLRFNPEKNRSLADKFGFLNHMDDGHRRYAFNVLSGSIDGHEACIFDYHYETYSTDSEGRRRTRHYYFSIFTIQLPAFFPELVITREGIFAKIGQAMGFDDIDFESVEFSKRYSVKSKDKKFAYDFCNVKMIDYLLEQEDLIIEVDGSTLALTFKGKLAIERIRPNIDRLLNIRSLIPNYTFSN
ncbi:MAG: hypothetical protein AAF065_05935 [Verrucomicrobiota bacterium]